jgi:hypothetical protein
VVVFICNHCPYVKSSIGRIVRDARDLRPLGVGFVAINSNDAVAYPEDSFEKMQAFAREHGIDFPYLHDEEQSVARAYGAVCTPDFFGFNADLKLQYRGRLDAARTGPAPDDMKRELYDAMVKVAKTGEGPREQHAFHRLLDQVEKRLVEGVRARSSRPDRADAHPGSRRSATAGRGSAPGRHG